MDAHFATSGQRAKAIVARGGHDVYTPENLKDALEVDNKGSNSKASLRTNCRVVEQKHKGSAFASVSGGLSVMADRQYEYGPADDDGHREFLCASLSRSSTMGTGKVITAAQMAKFWEGSPQATTMAENLPATNETMQL